jgi:hypothetical protein
MSPNLINECVFLIADGCTRTLSAHKSCTDKINKALFTDEFYAKTKVSVRNAKDAFELALAQGFDVPQIDNGNVDVNEESNEEDYIEEEEAFEE